MSDNKIGGVTGQSLADHAADMILEGRKVTSAGLALLAKHYKALRAAQQPERNQCDGCQSGAILDDEGMHRTSSGRPVMACQAHKYVSSPEQAKVPDGENADSVVAAYKAGLAHGQQQPDYEFEFASGSLSDAAYAIGYNEGYERLLAAQEGK